MIHHSMQIRDLQVLQRGKVAPSEYSLEGPIMRWMPRGALTNYEPERDEVRMDRNETMRGRIRLTRGECDGEMCDVALRGVADLACQVAAPDLRDIMRVVEQRRTLVPRGAALMSRRKLLRMRATTGRRHQASCPELNGAYVRVNRNSQWQFEFKEILHHRQYARQQGNCLLFSSFVRTPMGWRIRPSCLSGWEES